MCATRLSAVAKKSMLSDKAQQVAKDTGAQIYWMDASESAGQINKDIATMATIGSLLGG